MEKEVTVKTSSGGKVYKVSEHSGTYYCYKWQDVWLSSSWSSIGSARSMEDALIVIKSHASQYGTVYDVNFK